MVDRFGLAWLAADDDACPPLASLTPVRSSLSPLLASYERERDEHDALVHSLKQERLEQERRLGSLLIEFEAARSSSELATAKLSELEVTVAAAAEASRSELAKLSLAFGQQQSESRDSFWRLHVTHHEPRLEG